jgi:glycosyltransferase involved in cell wall biosynthesis
MTPPACSVIILTCNEEANLGPCLDSLAAFDDVHVLDSGSTDATVELARRRGVAVHSHPFTSFGAQRNWAIDNVPARHPWVLHVDADERVTPELAEEIARTVAADPAEGGFQVPSRLMFGGRWLRHAGDYPTYQVRLFHRDRLRFADYGHGQREVTKFSVGTLQQPYLHYAFSKGLDSWFAKHAVYARLEAAQALRELSDGAAAGPPGWGRTARRRWLKRFAYRLPFRYAFRLAYLLFVRGAFLDGPAGVTYAHMLATYEGMIEVHLRLLRHGGRP